MPCEERPLFVIMVTLQSSYTGVLQIDVNKFPGLVKKPTNST